MGTQHTTLQPTVQGENTGLKKGREASLSANWGSQEGAASQDTPSIMALEIPIESPQIKLNWTPLCVWCVCKDKTLKTMTSNNCKAKTGWNGLQTLKSQEQLCHTLHIITLQQERDESRGIFHFWIWFSIIWVRSQSIVAIDLELLWVWMQACLHTHNCFSLNRRGGKRGNLKEYHSFNKA